MIPKSKTLRQIESEKSAQQVADQSPPVVAYDPGQKIKIKKVECFNDFVAILQFRIHVNGIELGDSGFKQEGMVVGFGPGLPSTNGTRCPSQLSLGKVVAFYGNPVTSMEPKQGLFAGHKIIMVSERNIICGLPPVEFEIVE
jgi:hypothetical protein